MARPNFYVLLLVVICVTAQPTRITPQRRNSKFLARQEVETATTMTPEALNAPYPAAGFRPGRAFDLPTEDEEARAAETTPETTGKPADRYGPPEEPTTTVNPQENDVDTNPYSEVEDLARNTDSSDKEEAATIPDGLYYIQLPNGLEQLVLAVPESDQNGTQIKIAKIVEPQSLLVAPSPQQSYSFVQQFQTW